MIGLIFSVAQCFSNFLITYICLSGLFEKRRTNNKINLTAVLLAAIILALINSAKNPMLNTIFSLIIVAAMLILLFKAQIAHLVFSAIIAVSIIIGCEFIPIAIIAIWGQAAVFDVVNKTIQYVSFAFISTGIYFVIAIIIKLVFSKIKKTKTQELNPALLPVPIFSIAIIYYVFFISNATALNSTMIVASIAIVLVLLIINVLVFLSDNDSRKKHLYLSQITEMQFQSELKESLIAQQSDHIKQVNALVHDFKNQLLMLQTLISDGVANSTHGNASQYIDEALQELPKFDMFVEMKSEAFRCILLKAVTDCEKSGIELHTDIEFSNFEFMKYADICIIFSNLFDNAIKASTELIDLGKPATISLKIRSKNHYSTVTMTNSKINAVEIINGVIQTTKVEKNRHGIGLKNVETAVKKYDGSFTFEFTEDKFTVAIILPTSLN